MRKFWFLCFILLFGLILSGCEITDNTKPIEQETLTCDMDNTQAKCYDPETWDWQYNKTGFNGKGMTILILTDTPEEINPYLLDYVGNRKVERMEQIKAISDAYNVLIQIKKYPGEAGYGKSRLNWFNNLGENKITDQGDIFEVAQNFIVPLESSNVFSELAEIKYNKITESYDIVSGLIKEYGLENNNGLTKYRVGNKVYAYYEKDKHAEQFLLYNKDLVERLALEDPATLWNEDSWDYSAFVNYLATLNGAIDEETYAIGGFKTQLLRGILAGLGQKLIDEEKESVLFLSQELISCIEELKALNVYWNPYKKDICDAFINGTQLFQPCFISYLANNKAFEECDFTIGVVPYPSKDGDTQKANYLIPVAINKAWAIRNVESDETGLSSSVLFNILDDLMRGLKPQFKGEFTSKEEAYQTYLASFIKDQASIEAIMSLEINIDESGYPDLLNRVVSIADFYSDWGEDNFFVWGESLFVSNNNPEKIFLAHIDNYQRSLDRVLLKR